MPSLINSFTSNRGSDNIFSNNANTQSNIERVDLIRTDGIYCRSTTKQGFLINERGGNDPFKIAVITALNNNEVAGLGSLKSIAANQWGKNGPSIITRVMAKKSSDPSVTFSPRQDLTAQPLSGIYMSLGDLGVSEGETIYGIVLFPNDVTQSMDLIGLTNVPTQTAEASGGLDLIAGGGYFIEENLLSVTLSQFTASPNSNSIAVSWSTATESNTDRFELERSNDGIRFAQIATLSPKGAGNYQYQDNNISNGDNFFYRLKIVDRDGAIQFSNVVKVSVSGMTRLTVYPNPAQGHVNINIPPSFINKYITISLFDQQGRTVFKSEKQNSLNSEKISLTGLPKGIYRLQVKTGEGEAVNQSIYKK